MYDVKGKGQLKFINGEVSGCQWGLPLELFRALLFRFSINLIVDDGAGGGGGEEKRMAGH